MSTSIKVVLNSDVKKLGYKGDVVTVKRGFFRNFLSPRTLADYASEARLKVVENRKEKLVMARQQVLDMAKDVLAKIKDLKVVITGKMTKTGKLYGSVTEEKVIAAIKDACKVELTKEQIKMEHFKDLGEHKVLVHLGEGLEETVVVEVSGEKA
ncbi:50S ribosomal protein L9 [Candidatus Peregrinibacteria bacterium]|nr:50S ribosomal protein L9 [Candidatus Peregrinibacteria bacterium]